MPRKPRGNMMSHCSTGATREEKASLRGGGSAPTQADSEAWAFSIDELAAKVRVSRSSIRRAIARGELEAVKFGALTRIMASEAHRWASDAPRVALR